MSKYLIYSLLFLVVASKPASSQDLNTLRERASQLWTARLQGNVSKAEEFVEKEGRAGLPMYTNLREATVTAFEFTQDKSRVRVTTNAKAFLPPIGNVDQTINESWVWKADETNWFVHVEPSINPFQTSGVMSATTVRQGFTFQLVNKKVDLGAHKQGDTIKGTAKFVSDRSQLEIIRARGMEGFRVGATRWIDAKNGEFDFTIDSSLISQDIEQTVLVEAVGPERVFEARAVTDNLTLVGRIEGKIRISQLPLTPEAEKGRFVELEFKNVGKASLRVERMHPLDANFVVPDSLLPLALAPGQTSKISISHPTQEGLVDGELTIQLSEGVWPSNSALFRIKGLTSLRTGQQQPAVLDRATIDAAIRQAAEDAARRRVQ